MSAFLTTIAAGLQGNHTDVLNLSVDQVSLQFFSSLRSYFPWLDRFLAVVLPVAILLTGLWQHVSRIYTLTSGVQKSLLSHLTVPGSHELNKLVCSHLSKQGFGQNPRSVQLAPYDTASKDSNGLNYLPAPTTDAWFKFNGTWLKFTRKDVQTPNNNFHPFLHETPGVPDPDVTLSCFSLTGNVKPIRDFLDHLKQEAKGEKHTTRIIRIIPGQGGYGGFGTRSVYKPARKLDSVAMDASKKSEMVTTMTDFIASENWYADQGIPWRIGYLFYGPPGTGKTSIATAIAGHFNIPLVIVSLAQPGMNDTTLQQVFDDLLPPNCVCLLEDIDSAGIGREGTAKPADEDSDNNPSDPRTTALMSRPVKPKPGVSLAGLLNAIDGAASHEGRILVCTTNSPNSLDPALLRPGRIDMKILFGNASAEVTESLFRHIYKDISGERTSPDVAQMGRRFAASIPEKQVTPAEIQNFLLPHRTDPSKALDGVEAWVKDMLASKKQSGNVASFEGQI
ncbi:uncharacterized protein RCC_06408 [Ramularia collo-cygni]|uniref:P-loop containing nucleoside triphosphate hydrolase protein n=1 Tax=Ramularia collo-cygni TaxID=112498 RepID=A0A2D3V530_9PEZI|nr:uncharacterized protein RCC_06408 [Ramularia collo-cygni]CZT20550.1 uncharacterized protein RCC_06408 [Ramularia collo-cygni]